MANTHTFLGTQKGFVKGVSKRQGNVEQNLIRMRLRETERERLKILEKQG